MDLILIVREGEDTTTLGLLRPAAEKLGVEVILQDYRKPVSDLDPSAKHLLYRVSPSRESVGVERALNERYVCVSLVRYPFRYSPDAISELAGLPVLPTETVDDLDAEALAAKVDRVGGFPVVVKDKIPGGHGVGIIKVEGMDSLLSVGRMVFDLHNRQVFQIQKFAPHPRHARLIVLGDEIVDSIAYNANPDDFRTNRSAEEIDVEPCKFSPETEQLAIRATRANGFDFGGVDILEDGDARYLLEVNNPAYFARAELCTGVPTSERMIEYLLAKADYAPRNRWPADRPKPRLLLVNRPTDTGVRSEIEKQARLIDLPVVTVDPAAPLPDLPADEPCLLYRTSVDARPREMALYRQHDCTSLADDYPVLGANGYERNRHFRDNGLPFIPKVPVVRRQTAHLKEQLDVIGRFPLLVKSWDAKTTAYARADSFHTYISLTDYLLALGKNITIQPFVDVGHFGRVVVLGDEVVSSIEYLSRDPDGYAYDRFDVVVAWDCPPEARELAVAAAKSQHLDFAAVNLLVDQDGQAWIEEVLFPFFFRRDEHIAGANVTERMLDFLLAKCAEKHGF